MKQELKHFDRVNKNLALIVEDLRMRQRGLNRELAAMKKALKIQQGTQKRFQDDITELVHLLGDFKGLKKGVIRLYKVWVLAEGNDNMMGAST